ncbi:hypothetical protein AB6A40_000636 [Gnathostoma spinigerum]|uniref:Apoptogenic protein 1 n=1 Tax=Gnathostoma spinigerum TaxID=75299 RepID=A0ABD6EBR4_9BILA
MSQTERHRRLRLDRRFDWVGPPDPISRIRPIRLRRLPNESATEREYRNAAEALNKWNSKFWVEHNTLFEKEKQKFLDEKRQKKGRIERLSPDDLSDFYRRFLNERHEALIAYNKEWYRRNLSLLWPAFKVNMIRFVRMLRRR